MITMDAIGRTILAALILSAVMRNMNDMIPNSNLSNMLPGTGITHLFRAVREIRSIESS
jgi:hypothetical protein